MAGADQMRQYTERYDALKAELQSLGFLFQGSLQTRRIACGKTTCRCYHDPDARHGPYHYWTRKARGKTVGMRLTEDELVLYQEWIENNRKLERIVREMRGLSSRVLALITGRRPHEPPRLGLVVGGDRYRHPSDATSRPLTVPRLRLPAKKTRPITDFCKRLHCSGFRLRVLVLKDRRHARRRKTRGSTVFSTERRDTGR